MAYDNSGDKTPPAGRIKLNFTGSKEKPTMPTYTGDITLFDGTWLSTKLWKPNPDKETKLSFNGNVKFATSGEKDKDGYISIMKAQDKAYVLYGWIKMKDDVGEFHPAYRFYLYPDEVRTAQGALTSFNVSGMVFFDEQTAVAAINPPQADFDDIPF